MKDLEVSSGHLLNTKHGEIIEIRFGGRYPAGSLGNEHAAWMTKKTEEILAERRPAAVVYDLRDLNYRWGDAIGELAHVLRDPERNRMTLGCVLAIGETKESLEPLFEPHYAFGALGLRLFEDERSALDHLLGCLSEEAD